MTVQVEVVCEGLAHPEGPALLRDGRFVFVETFKGRVSQWRPGGEVAVFANCGGGPNACAVGDDGVYITQMGTRARGLFPELATVPSIQRIGWDGAVTTVVTEVAGAPLRAPNDLCFSAGGSLLFTDPGRFDLAAPEHGMVYAVRPDGAVELELDVGPTFPNGIVALADGSIVWVESYTRTVRRRDPAGAVSEIATLPKGHMPDGLKASAAGDLFVTTISSGGIDVVSLDGARHDFLATGGEPLNCVFAGTSLYVTDGGLIPYTDPASVTTDSGRLLRIDAGVAGMPVFSGRVAAAS